MPQKKRDRIERFDELHDLLRQSMILAENVARLDTLTGHADQQVAELAALILEIARVLPGKRNRWLKLVRQDRPLFNRAVEVFGVEFFEDLLQRAFICSTFVCGGSCKAAARPRACISRLRASYSAELIFELVFAVRKWLQMLLAAVAFATRAIDKDRAIVRIAAGKNQRPGEHNRF